MGETGRGRAISCFWQERRVRPSLDVCRRGVKVADVVVMVALGKETGECRQIGLATSVYRIWAKTRYLDCRIVLESKLLRPFFAAALAVGAAAAVFGHGGGGSCGSEGGVRMYDGGLATVLREHRGRADAPTSNDGGAIGKLNASDVACACFEEAHRHAQAGVRRLLGHTCDDTSTSTSRPSNPSWRSRRESRGRLLRGG